MSLSVCACVRTCLHARACAVGACVHAVFPRFEIRALILPIETCTISVSATSNCVGDVIHSATRALVQLHHLKQVGDNVKHFTSCLPDSVLMR